MAIEESNLLTGDWRSAPPTSSAGRVEPDWHQTLHKPRRRLRRVQFVAAWLGLLALTSGLIWASTWLQPPKSSSLVLIGATYDDNLAVPLNTYGWQGLDDLAGVARGRDEFSFWGSRLLELQQEPLLLSNDSVWHDTLLDVRQSTVILFLALHGAADGNGAYLLPQDAQPGDRSERLRLAAVLDRLAALPSEKHKVLILDATQMAANWQFGVLHNDFVRQLEAMSPRIEQIPNLIVLSSTAADQRSWTSDEWQRSIFAHYLIEGCRGGAKDPDQNGRIDAWEWFCFIRDGVQQWAQVNRDALQTPILLPAGELGRQRAERVDVATYESEYQPPDPHATVVFSPPAELAAAWNVHREMATEIPSPAVYTPALWRQYQDRLLRYEQLIRSGDQHGAAKQDKHLRELRLQIEAARPIQLASIGNSLAMPIAAGMGQMPTADESEQDPTQQALQRIVNQLWNAKPQELAKRWAAIQTSNDTGLSDPVLLRLRVSGLLIARAAVDPAKNLDKACSLLQAVHDPTHPRPAEAHYLLMTERDLPAPITTESLADVVSLALTVRCQAERATLGIQPAVHPYSEQVYPWIASTIEQADVARRAGEDLLFGSSASWSQAQAHLQQAQELYDRALQAAAQVQAALAVRDEVLAQLPYYSKWCARRRATTDDAQLDKVASADQLATLWDDTHALAAMLASPQEALLTGPASEKSGTGKLATQTVLVRRSYDQLVKQLNQRWQEMAQVDLPSVWSEIEDALLVPTGDTALRMKLLTNKRRTSRQLLIQSTLTATSGAAIPAARNRDEAMTAARREGRLAMATLGQHWFDACPGDGLEKYEQVAHRLAVFDVEQQWWTTLTVAGQQVARRWQAMPGAIVGATNEASQQDDLQARESLFRADQLNHQISGAATVNLDVNASELYRQIQLQQLLKALAERTLLDHWFSEDPKAEPYYRIAGLIYMTDAERMDAHVDGLQELKNRLNQPGELTFVGAPSLDLTTELNYQLDYQVEPVPNAQVPPGQFVVWAESGQSLELDDPQADQRMVRAFDPKKPSSTVRYALSSPALREAEKTPPPDNQVAKTSLSLHGLFRGQQLTIELPVALHLRPEVTERQHPLPNRSTLAVRAKASLHAQYGEGSGALAIVLDCSGSMGPGLGQSYSAQTKYAEATAALQAVLDQLPNGTTVSLWTFGQAQGANKTVEQAEDTIRQVLAPVVWNRQDPTQLSNLMGRIQYPSSEPWNESPIMAAMMAAKADLDHAQGFKTLVVLTDGMDNRFASDTKLNPDKRDVATAVRQVFGQSGIVINIVGFKVVGAEKGPARDQFQVVESLSPPGQLFTVDETQQLAATLDTAFRQRLRYWVDDYDNQLIPGVPTAGLDVSRDQATDQWFPGGVEPGSYKLRSYTNQPVEAPISLERGDMLLLELSEQQSAPRFGRLSYSETYFPWRMAQEVSGWRCAVLQNQQLPDQSLQMLLTLEKTPSANEQWLQVIKPRETWLELVPPSGETYAGVVSWGPQNGYPAPAWKFEAPRWQQAADGSGPVAPKLRVWWNPDQEPTYAATLNQTSDYANLDDLRDRAVQIAGRQVRIENVRVEDHYVETAPGRRELQSCLVVRLVHDLGQPIWVRPGGLKSAGHEHRFYSGVGRYTGLFWPINLDAATNSLASLHFVSLDHFKRRAEERGYALELDSLSTPQPNDVCPKPPLETN